MAIKIGTQVLQAGTPPKESSPLIAEMTAPEPQDSGDEDIITVNLVVGDSYRMLRCAPFESHHPLQPGEKKRRRIDYPLPRDVALRLLSKVDASGKPYFARAKETADMDALPPGVIEKPKSMRALLAEHAGPKVQKVYKVLNPAAQEPSVPEAPAAPETDAPAEAPAPAPAPTPVKGAAPGEKVEEV